MILPTLLLLIATSGAAAATLDLKQAVVISPAQTKDAAKLLVEEIAQRTTIRLPVSEGVSGRPVIELAAGKSSPGDDGFRIEQTGMRLRVTGNTPRGTLFGAGYLLRHLAMDLGRLELSEEMHVTTTPVKPLRGHQIGYRPKVNTYDAWTPAIFEQYVRDLIVFEPMQLSWFRRVPMMTTTAALPLAKARSPLDPRSIRRAAQAAGRVGAPQGNRRHSEPNQPGPRQLLR
jgi:hypothetical protein